MPNKRYHRYALGGALPTRRMVPPSPPRQQLPMGVTNPRATIPGGSQPRGGALASMARQQMQQRMRGRLPNRPGGPVPGRPSFPGMSGQRRALGALQAPGGVPGGIGPQFPPPRPPQVPPGPPRDMIGPGPNVPPQGRFRGFSGPPGGPDGMARLQQLRDRMGGQRYAKGGKVKRAVAALNRARAMLHDSDPDFDHIASLMSKDIPGSGALAAKIRKAASAKAKTKDPDEFRPAWQAIEKDFKALKKALSQAE